MRQGRDDPIEAYYRIFEVVISMSDLEKCNTTTHMELNKAYATGDNEYGTKRFQEMCLIISSDPDRYSGIWNDPKNITLLGTENYPKNTTAAHNVLCHYNKMSPPRQVHAQPAAVIFVKNIDTDKNNTTPRNNGISLPEVTCYCYQEKGHYAGNFPPYTANTCTGSQSLKVGLTMTQTKKEEPTINNIKPNWILLDT